MLEENLKIIKDAKLDIELLRRENAKQCRDNDFKIGELNITVGVTEKLIEEELKESGEKKLGCKLGWCAYRVMPDKWEYDDQIILAWCKQHDMPFYHVVEAIERMKLKKAILGGDVKLEDVQVEDLTTKDYQRKSVQGIVVTEQAPKFNYKLNGGL